MKKSSFYIFFILILGSLLFVESSYGSATNGTIDTTDKYAWSENIGWINFGTTEGGVTVTDSELTGYAWSENTGWISLNCSNDNSCSTVDHSIVNNGSGALSGYAWSENTGWISFNCSNDSSCSTVDYSVSINSSGEFNGYAWSENTGWVSFNCSNDSSCSTVDYKVSTDYRPQSSRSACNNSLDDDGDGLTDYPNDPGCSSTGDSDETDVSTTSGGGSGFSVPSTPNVVPSDNGSVIELKNDGLIFNITNVSQMAISTDPDFKYSSWQPYMKNYDYNTEKDVTYYIKFRSPDGGESKVYTVDVKVKQTGIINSTPEQKVDDISNSTQTRISNIFTKFLSIGDSNEEVKQLQLKLKELGYFTYPTATGYFGNITKEAVAKFQQANLKTLGSAPGFVGPGTRALLNKVSETTTVTTPAKVEETTTVAVNNNYKFTSYLYFGNSGEEVEQLQLKLKKLGYFTYPTATGYFGGITKEAVIDYQKSKNLIPYPGWVGPQTREELNK